MPEPRRRDGTAWIIAVLLATIALTAVVTNGMRSVDNQSDVARLEGELSKLDDLVSDQLAVMRDVKGRLDKLCTHFKTGCSEVYRGR